MDHATSRGPAPGDDRRAWAEPGAEDLGGGLYRIPLPLPGDALTAVNVYAITGHHGVDLIDAGMALAHARERLSSTLGQLGYALPDIRNFFITHIHQDHYTLAVQLRTTLRGQIALGEAERANMNAIRDVAAGRAEVGFIDMLPRMGAAELAAKVHGILDPRLADPQPKLEWSDPDRWLPDGALLHLPGRTLRAIHTPGHTAGHVVFHDEAAAVLFAGDHVLPHITPSIGFQPVITRLALSQYLGSLRLMLALPDTRLLPAHGPVQPSTHARVHQLLEHHEVRLAQTLEAASNGPVTAFEAAGALPWTRRQRKLTELDPMNQLLATGETAAHLEVLVIRGQLARETTADGIDRFGPPPRSQPGQVIPNGCGETTSRSLPPYRRRPAGWSSWPPNVGAICWNGCVESYTPGQLARVLRVPEPTAEQAAVIGAPLGPLAIVAGAGSGKSETMAARLVWLVANGLVRPDRVLGLTFTRKAAAELAERVRARLDALRRARLAGAPADEDLGPWAGDPVISTYHAYAGRLVSDHALREGLEPSMRLITAALSWQLASSIVAAYDGPMDEVQWTPQTVTAAVLDLAGDLSEHLRSSADVRGVGSWLETEAARWPGRVLAQVRQVIETQRTREQLLPLVDRYAAAKRAREVVDHGDQVAIAARIAARHPEVGAAERTRYQAVLLDEYQDTSHAQLVLLRALFGGGHPVTAVGDPCQSIYGWRGASAGNLRRFAQDFRDRLDRPAPVCQLSTSFRNAGRVLDTAAVLQTELRAQAPDVPVLQPAPDRAGRGAVRAALLATMTAEADWVAAQAAALLALPPGTAPDGQPWPDGRLAGVRPSDIAVLCRKRSQFVPLRRALEARGIPCEVVGLGGLLSVPEVQDVVATLRVLHDAASSDALARLLTGPRWRIGPRDLVALGRRARYLATPPASPAAPSRADDAPPDQAGTAGTAGTAGPPEDPLAGAVTDLTTPDNAASLVEALDDLGDQAEYSEAGYARLSALAAETRRLREHVTRPLADLIAEVERTLSLDIEVAARPGGDMAAARADLDAFTDVAATFAGDQPEPTLGAFIAYLAAAQQEEFGLETGRVGESDTVKLLTVHAAKGLQWPAVFIPGLAAGEKSRVFPARPKAPTRWTRNPRLIPFPLRGDAADLPALTALDADSVAEFNEACTARDLAEERRLAYVAATRAAFWLGCSGYWWGEATAPLGPSVFLTEVRAACQAGAGTVAQWADQPAQDAENPLLAAVDEADWPATPAGRQHAAVAAAAALVDEARTAAEASRDPAPAAAEAAAAGSHPASKQEELNEQERELVAAWELDTGLLLAEREQRRARGDGPVEVMLPARLSVSALVALARDPDELARQVRRPMPQPPARQARRGTAFHRWLEERFSQQRLIDDDDLFAADDDPEPDENLMELRARFEAGEWGGRWPREVEVPFDTRIGDRQVRGRIDAVFADPNGGYDVVDWKTGQLPRTKAERDAVAVQLAAYRLAWAALADVPLHKVRAAFYYVRHDRTVRPADLLTADGLRDLINRVPQAS